MDFLRIFRSFRRSPPPAVFPAPIPLVVTEGIESRWRYHLSNAKGTTRSLCGAKTMHTAMQLSAWGTVSHLNERYCPQCAHQAEQDFPGLVLRTPPVAGGRMSV